LRLNLYENARFLILIGIGKRPRGHIAHLSHIDPYLNIFPMNMNMLHFYGHPNFTNLIQHYIGKLSYKVEFFWCCGSLEDFWRFFSIWTHAIAIFPMAPPDPPPFPNHDLTNLTLYYVCKFPCCEFGLFWQSGSCEYFFYINTFLKNVKLWPHPSPVHLDKKLDCMTASSHFGSIRHLRPIWF
jgi:hypothetical protein